MATGIKAKDVEVIVATRVTVDLAGVLDKVLRRDLFGGDA